MNKELLQIDKPIVYFDQWIGAPHAVCWSKSFVFVLKLCYFLRFLFFFPFVTDKDGKTFFKAETNDFGVEHPFAGQNKQHRPFNFFAKSFVTTWTHVYDNYLTHP